MISLSIDSGAPYTRKRLPYYFLDLSGALLLAITVVLVVSLQNAAQLTLPRDAVFQISLRVVYWMFAGLALGVALFCFFSQKTHFKAALILWATINTIVYAVGIQWNDSKGELGAYFSCVADAFDLAPATALWIAKIICLYLLIGSCAVLFFAKNIPASQNQEGTAEPLKIGGVNDPRLITSNPIEIGRNISYVRTLKISCTACGGHIEFPTNFFGEKISCPHCQASIVLQKAKNLKMSCAACEGHIEFPDHALGQTIDCPHCAIPIILQTKH